MDINYDVYKKDRLIYIAEAAVEYLISLLVTGSYLAKLTTALGFSDSITGILTSFISLGCSFQIACTLIPSKNSVKSSCIFFGLFNEVLFTLLYIVPVVNVPGTVKTVVFVLMILSAHITMNVINPVKINWYMSMVDNRKRGVFTANKEIISLAAGTAFTFLMGNLADRFDTAGNEKGFFIVCAATIFSMSVIHCLLYIFTKDDTGSSTQNQNSIAEIKGLIKNKKYLQVVAICAVWNIATHIATPFYGTYQIKELGFSMTRVAAYSFAYSATRAAFSRLLGRLADKKGFIKMTLVCFLCAMTAFLINTFTVPANGKVLYIIYYCIYAISLAGVNSSLINLVFDVVKPEYRKTGIAFQRAIYGVFGFLATIAVSPLVAYIQNNGNRLFGIPVYAQQVVSLLACIIITCLCTYVLFTVKKQKEH